MVAVDDQGARGRARGRAAGASGNPPEAAAATRDKAAMRRALAAAGVQPEHRTVGPGDEPAAVAPRSGFLRRKAALAVGEPRRDPGG